MWFLLRLFVGFSFLSSTLSHSPFPAWARHWRPPARPGARWPVHAVSQGKHASYGRQQHILFFLEQSIRFFYYYFFLLLTLHPNASWPRPRARSPSTRRCASAACCWRWRAATRLFWCAVRTRRRVRTTRSARCKFFFFCCYFFLDNFSITFPFSLGFPSYDKYNELPSVGDDVYPQLNVDTSHWSPLLRPFVVVVQGGRFGWWFDTIISLLFNLNILGTLIFF